MDEEIRFLILEDNAADVELIRRELERGQFLFSARQVQTKEAFLDALQEFSPHFILADYSLLQFDGISALKIVQEQSPDIPFIFVTGFLGEEVAVETLKMGATDYVFKDRLSRLLPAVRKALREAGEQRDRKQVERMLEESEEKYRSLVESTEDSIYVVDKECKYLFMNKKHILRMSLSDYEYLGRPYGEFHSDEETRIFVEKINEIFERGKSVRYEHKSRRDGRYFLLTLSPVKKADGLMTAVTVVSKDINDMKELEERLRTLSLTDELTGLYNRRGFFILVEQLLKQSRREKRGIFMLYADLDHLKAVNDTWGHKEGDIALIETTNILKKTFRESDIVSRIGGDEFVVIPIGTTGDNIKGIIRRLQQNIADENAKKNRGYDISLSVGTAYYDPASPCSIDELLAQGDKLMYENKRCKRGS